MHKIFRLWKSSDLVRGSDETFYIWATASAAFSNTSNKQVAFSVCLYYAHSSGSDQSQREEDFYYTKISCEAVDASSAPAPSQQAPGQAPSSHLSWVSSSSPPGLGLQIPPAHRPRSNSSSGLGVSRPSPLSQSAPCSFWQIHSEHLYQVCSSFTSH